MLTASKLILDELVYSKDVELIEISQHGKTKKNSILSQTKISDADISSMKKILFNLRSKGFKQI